MGLSPTDRMRSPSLVRQKNRKVAGTSRIAINVSQDTPAVTPRRMPATSDTRNQWCFSSDPSTSGLPQPPERIGTSKVLIDPLPGGDCVAPPPEWPVNVTPER